MIGECKKLFRRDRTYLLCLTGLIALVLLYGLTGCYKMIELREITDANLAWEQSQMLWSLWGGEHEADCYYNTMRLLFCVVAAVMLVKWHMLEGRRGREFQKLLPVKDSSYITYDFFCGIVFIWIPHALSWLIFNGLTSSLNYDADYYVWLFEKVGMLFILNTFLYVSLVFAKKITNNIPGALLSAFVIWFGIWWIGSTDFFVESPEVVLIGMPALILLTILCIPAAYICDKKRDISGNGTFSFTAAHYLILGALFYELAYVFSIPAEENLLGVIGGVLLSGVVAVGMHYLTKPKRL